MPVWPRDHLSQFNSCFFPLFSFIAITKIVRRARSIKHDEPAKIVLALEHMSQCGTQWRDTRTHRYKNQIPSLLFGQIKTMARDAEQFNPLTPLHIKQRDTRADTAFDQNLNFPVVRRAGKSEVSRLLVIHAQDPDLAGNEIDPAPAIFILRHEIE